MEPPGHLTPEMALRPSFQPGFKRTVGLLDPKTMSDGRGWVCYIIVHLAS